MEAERDRLEATNGNLRPAEQRLIASLPIGRWFQPGSSTGWRGGRVSAEAAQFNGAARPRGEDVASLPLTRAQLSSDSEVSSVQDSRSVRSERVVSPSSAYGEYLRVGYLFRRWRKRWMDQRAFRAASRAALLFWRSRILKQSFSAWARKADPAQARARVRTAMVFWAHRRLVTSLYCWRSALVRERAATSTRASRLARRTLVTWRRALASRAHARRAQAHARVKLWQLRLKYTLSSWRRAAVLAVVRRRIERTRYHTVKMSSFVSWRAETARVQLAQSLRRRLVLWGTLRGWRSVLWRKARVESASMRHRARTASRIVSRILHTWRDAALDRRQFALAERHSNASSKARALLWWRSKASRNRFVRERLVQIKERRRSSRLRSQWTAWTVGCSRNRVWRSRVAAAVRMAAYRARARAISTWIDVTATRRRRREQKSFAYSAWARTMAFRRWRLWRHKLAESQKTTASICASLASRRVFRAWRRVQRSQIALKIHAEAQERRVGMRICQHWRRAALMSKAIRVIQRVWLRRAIRTWQATCAAVVAAIKSAVLRRQIRVLRAWRCAARGRKRARESGRRVRQRRGIASKRRSFKAWCMVLRNRQVMLSRAIGFANNKAKQKTGQRFLRWRVLASKLARCNRIAARAESEKKSQLLGFAFRGWRGVFGFRLRVRRIYVQGAARVWRTNARRIAMQKQRQSRAFNARCKRLLGRGWDRWTQAFRDNMRLSAVEKRASSLSRARRLRHALRVWTARKDISNAEKIRLQSADAHADLAVLGRSLAVWVRVMKVNLIAKQVVSARNERLVSRALRAWTRNPFLNPSYRKVIFAMRHPMMHRGFVTWRWYAREHAYFERARQCARFKALKRSVLVWRSAAKVSAQLARRVALVRARAIFSTRARFFKAWKEFFGKVHAVRLAVCARRDGTGWDDMDADVDVDGGSNEPFFPHGRIPPRKTFSPRTCLVRWRARWAVVGISRWRQALAQSRRDHAVSVSIASMRARAAATMAWRSWRSEFLICRRTRRVLLVTRARRMVSALARWASFVASRKTTKLSHLAADTSRSARVARAVLFAWRTALVRSRAEREKARVAVRIAKRHAMSRVWVTWRRGLRHIRAWENGIIVFWQHRRLNRTFTCWFNVVLWRSHVRAGCDNLLSRRARVALLAWRRALARRRRIRSGIMNLVQRHTMGPTFTRWRVALLQRRRRRAQLTIAGRYQEALLLKSARKCLNVWHSRAAQAVRLRKALRVYQTTRIVPRNFRAWRRFTRSNRAAEKHAFFRRVLKAWGAWRGTFRSRRVLKAREMSAVVAMSVLRTRRAITLWRRYVQTRDRHRRVIWLRKHSTVRDWQRTTRALRRSRGLLERAKAFNSLRLRRATAWGLNRWRNIAIASAHDKALTTTALTYWRPRVLRSALARWVGRASKHKRCKDVYVRVTQLQRSRTMVAVFQKWTTAWMVGRAMRVQRSLRRSKVARALTVWKFNSSMSARTRVHARSVHVMTQACLSRRVFAQWRHSTRMLGVTRSLAISIRQRRMETAWRCWRTTQNKATSLRQRLFVSFDHTAKRRLEMAYIGWRRVAAAVMHHRRQGVYLRVVRTMREKILINRTVRRRTTRVFRMWRERLWTAERATAQVRRAVIKWRMAQAVRRWQGSARARKADAAMRRRTTSLWAKRACKNALKTLESHAKKRVSIRERTDKALKHWATRLMRSSYSRVRTEFRTRRVMRVVACRRATAAVTTWRARIRTIKKSRRAVILCRKNAASRAIGTWRRFARNRHNMRVAASRVVAGCRARRVRRVVRNWARWTGAVLHRRRTAWMLGLHRWLQAVRNRRLSSLGSHVEQLVHARNRRRVWDAWTLAITLRAQVDAIGATFARVVTRRKLKQCFSAMRGLWRERAQVRQRQRAEQLRVFAERQQRRMLRSALIGWLAVTRLRIQKQKFQFESVQIQRASRYLQTTLRAWRERLGRRVRIREFSQKIFDRIARDYLTRWMQCLKAVLRQRRRLQIVAKSYENKVLASGFMAWRALSRMIQFRRRKLAQSSNVHTVAVLDSNTGRALRTLASVFMPSRGASD